MTAEDAYMVISADSHAGLPTEQYREYLEQKYWPQFDEFLAGRPQALEQIRRHGCLRREVRKEVVRRSTKRVSKAAGTPSAATRRWTPTGYPPRSSSRMPTPSRAAPVRRSGPGSDFPATTTRSSGWPGPSAQPLARRDVR